MEQQQDSGATTEALDTFDDGSYTEGPIDGEQQEAASEEQSTEEVPKQAETKEEIDPDSQLNMLDAKEVKAEEEVEETADKEAEGSGEGDKVKEPESDGEEQTSENDGDSAEEIRNLKAFRDGKQYEIPEDAQLKVKVKGKWEKVPLTELRDNYAGKVAYDEKFQDLSSKAKHFENEKNDYQSEIEMIRNHLGEIAQLTTSAIKGEGSVTANMEYLLDLMGGNSLEYKKAMYDTMSEDLYMYGQMT